MSLATGGLGLLPAAGLVGLAGAGGAGAGLAAQQLAARDTAPVPTVSGNVAKMVAQGAGMAAGEGMGRGVESNWRQDAISSTGAVGVFQIMPETAAFMETDVFGFPLNEDVSINDNVYMGVRILSMLIDASGGDVDSAIASYYQGQGATDAGIMYEDTKGYVAAVRTVWQRFWQ